MKKGRSSLKFLLLIALSHSNLALSHTSLTGNFFEITTSGTMTALNITLCLNGRGPLSCQQYSVTQQTLSIRTLIPNHTYPMVGIKINTSRYTIANLGVDCIPIQNGYCLFSVNYTSPKVITIIGAFTTLSASVSTLALSVNDVLTNAALTGTPRTITITNSGAEVASNVNYNIAPALPSGTIITPSSCGTILPGGSCILTITPGSTPSATPGNTNPTPITLSIAGDNTNTLAPTINILTYGSVYQSGYVFAVDDTTPANTSIQGKVVTLSDQAAPNPSGIIWSSNGNGGTSADAVNDIIYGISQTSTTAAPDPTTPPVLTACNGNSDGSCNSNNIVTYYSPPYTTPAINPAFYAAGLCTFMIGGYSDWYLPAICEMSHGVLAGCGTQVSPTLQNMQSNLVDMGNIGGLFGVYSSSTELGAVPAFFIWGHDFAIGTGSNTVPGKAAMLGVRCVRIF